MSKKRTAADCNSDEQTNEGSESFCQKEDNAKRAKLDSLFDTTLHDLPFELLECILVKVVVMEVKDMHLAKSVWKEKADLVISRLSTVCPQWSSILTTNYFGNQVNRILNGTSKCTQETIRLEVLHEFPIQSAIHSMTTMKDEIFMLYRLSDRPKDYAINVYDRNNMVEVKDVIPLPRRDPVCMTGCNVSNCLYVGLRNKNCQCPSVLRISKDVGHRFNISPLINDHGLSISMISVSAKGDLVILSVPTGRAPTVVNIYHENGFLQHGIMLSPDIDAFSYENVIQKSNGNLVLAHVKNQNSKMWLSEIDMSGSIVRQYQSSFSSQSFVTLAHTYDRVMITQVSQLHNGIELFDSEFNLLGIYSLKQDEGKSLCLSDFHYDRERNEIMRIHCDHNTNVLTIFRFTEE